MLEAIEIAEKYGTRDAFEIARRAGIPVFFESWHPVTLGEFDRKRQAIRINLRAPEKGVSLEQVAAHELGHFFALGLNLSTPAEEDFACAFAENLLKIS